MLDGRRAHELGFADRLLEPAEFVDESIAYAVELATSPPETRPAVRPRTRRSWTCSSRPALGWTTPSTAPRRLPTGRST